MKIERFLWLNLRFVILSQNVMSLILFFWQQYGRVQYFYNNSNTVEFYTMEK